MTGIILFESNEIRRVWDEETETWYFAVVDIIGVLTDSTRPSDYWYRLKRRVLEDTDFELSTNCRQFPLKNSKNNRTYQTECANAEGLLRIIQSIPSPRAEPFKQWLARVGYERLQEIENPELAGERMRALYKAKGYPEDWIEKRIQSIAIRNQLTDEWDSRGVQQGLEFAILTNEIHEASFDLGVKAHKERKGLKRQNLRDNMTPLELVFTMLGEASTTEKARTDDAQGFSENQRAAQVGGKIAGDARRALELETGRPVVSSENYLPKSKHQTQLPFGDNEDEELDF